MVVQTVLIGDLRSGVPSRTGTDRILFNKHILYACLVQKVRGQYTCDSAADDQYVGMDILI